MSKETEIDQVDVIRSIKAAGGHAKKWASIWGVGNPDLVCALPGIGNFLVEVKTPSGKVQPKQAYELEQFKKGGGLSIVIIVTRKVSLNIFPWTDLCLWNSKTKTYDGILELVQKVYHATYRPKYKYKIPKDFIGAWK